ncbi:MAG: hypothetical protein EKK31_32240 [Hyphomicrobiales bacterium]|nr:MAG: hypothetical protein EKK31_32240 [Hyphomicrobiales bacterium]
MGERRARNPDALSRRQALERDPERWEPVFGKDHAPTKSSIRMTIQRSVILIENRPEASFDDA